MSRLQRMLIACSLASFAAGVSVGLAMPAAASSLSERPSESREQRYERDYVERLDRLLGLTEDQQRLVRVILRDEREQRTQIYETAGIAQQLPPELQSAWKLAAQKTDQRIEHILEPAQRTKYRELIQARDAPPPEPSPKTDSPDGK